MEDTTKESNNQALTLDAYNNLTKVINDEEMKEGEKKVLVIRTENITLEIKTKMKR